MERLTKKTQADPATDMPIVAKKPPEQPPAATDMPIVAKKPPEQPPAATDIPIVSTKPPGQSPAVTFGQREIPPAFEDRKRISAMRELANDVARSALAESAHRSALAKPTRPELVISTRITFLAAKAISLLSSTMAVAYILTHLPVALAGATFLFAIAIVLACRFFVLRRRLTEYELPGELQC